MQAALRREAGAKPAPRPSKADERGEEKAAEWWVGPVRWAALAVFVAIPAAAPFAQTLAGRVVWTMAVASLPLFIVLVGYHRWRRICPLAFFSQLPLKLGRPGKRKAPAWLEANYYYVVVAVFVVSLWLRLVATNGDGLAISTFFVLISAAALVSGVFFTGKTWCNYLCPVSFVEKIYTEPHGLRETPNSQCDKCTACKKFCPDINEENGYWKEIASRPKRIAYFAFPGLVFGFYFYYYLQAGAWSYYFDGRWTDEPRVFAAAFRPGTDAATAGLFFYPAVPRAVASFVLLILCAAASVVLFTLVERAVGAWLRRRGDVEDAADLRRHLTFSLAAFAAFVTFYTFAGAPTLWKLPWAVPHLFLVVVVITATAFLVRRLTRTQKRFAEETLARNILRRWEWGDEQAPPRDLREAFLVHTIRTGESARNAARVLEIYREAVADALAEGFVSREDVQKLERLRAQLNIRKADHDKLMSALAAEDRARLGDPTRHLPPEKWLQLKTYERALEKYLAEATGEADEDAFVARLREEYRVTKEEHDAVLDRLGGGRKVLAARLAEEVDAVERASSAIRQLEREESPLHDFLGYLLRRRLDTACARLLNVVGVEADDERAAGACARLTGADRSTRLSGLAELGRAASPLVAEHLAGVTASVADYGDASLGELLDIYTRSVDPYVRAAAVRLLRRADALESLRGDASPLVRETVAAAEAGEGSESPTTLEKMVALHAVGLFSELEPEELEELARACRPAAYEPGAVVCAEGERGDHVFVILAGEVRVVRGDEAELVAVERAGSVLGEMAVLDPAPRAATIHAGPTGARLLRLDGAAFLDTLREDPSIGAGLLKVMARRLRGSAAHR